MDWTAGADLSTGFWGSGPAPAPACAFAFAFFMATITFHSSGALVACVACY